jgi:hypothetical protein
MAARWLRGLFYVYGWCAVLLCLTVLVLALARPDLVPVWLIWGVFPAGFSVAIVGHFIDEGGKQPQPAPEDDWSPDWKNRALWFAGGAGLVVAYVLLTGAGHEGPAVEALGFVGVIVALLQFTGGPGD